VTAAQSNLQQILVAMRKLLHLPRLEYVSIQNQADFLIEVPVEVTDVPKVWTPLSFAAHAAQRHRKLKLLTMKRLSTFAAQQNATIISFLLGDNAFMHARMSPGLCLLLFGAAQPYSNWILIQCQLGIVVSKIDVHSSRCLVPKRAWCAGMGEGLQHQEDEQVSSPRGEAGSATAGDC